MATKRVGGNPIPVGPSLVMIDGLSAGSLNADLVGDGAGGGVDLSRSESFSLHLTGAWSGTLTFQGSNDNTNWTSVLASDLSSATSAPTSTTTSNKLLFGMVGFRYLRVRMTSYSSGTASGVLVLYSSAPQVVSVGGAINVTPIVAQSNNSLVAFRLASAATTNATSVKASAGRVYRTILSNPSAAIKYVKFYNKASAPTVGTDTPVATIALAANGGTYVTTEDIGWYFSTGIAFAITGAAADSDTTAVAANDVFVTLNYI